MIIRKNNLDEQRLSLNESPLMK